MEMANNLLACEQCVVADVVDGDLHADWRPSTSGVTQLASHAPRLRFDTTKWFAEQRLLGWIDNPGTIAIVGDTEILTIVVVGNRTSNALGARVASDNANALSIRLSNWFNGPRIIELKEIAIGGTRRKTRARRDTTAWDLHKEHRIGWLTDSNHSPLHTRLIWITSPQDLSRSVWLRLESRSSRVGDVCILMPGLLYIHTGSDDAGEHHTTDFVLGNWFNRDADATRVGFSVRPERLDRGIANETSEVHWAFVWIAKWGVKTDDSTDGHSGRTLIVNANGGSVANVGAISTATRESIASDSVSGREQAVVFRCSDIKSLARFNATGHYSIPNALKFASG